ncbi:MAG: hypothetical protein K2G83_02500 [Ruminococcus sp.]|nr:hypothetical protein [Ruminococcus sp.]
MITQSVAKQYGILPNEQEEMHYTEWLLLVGGIMEDTPLGQTVLIRKENDRDRLKHFTQHEHRIRNEWREFRTEQKKIEISPEKMTEYWENMFSEMFG